MEMPPKAGLTNRPPSPVHSTLQCKSFVKISSSNELSKDNPDMGYREHKSPNSMSSSSKQESGRRVPIFRSTSATPDRQPPPSLRSAFPEFDSLFNRFTELHGFGSDFPRQSRSRPQSPVIPIGIPSGKPHRTDGHLTGSNSGSSGYHSLSSSQTPIVTTRVIRRVPSLNQVYQQPGITVEFRQNCCRPKSNRYSFQEPSAKDTVVDILDKIDKRIVFFRQVAFELLDERNKLDDALKQILGSEKLHSLSEVDRADIEANANCLQHRLASVDVVIRPMRTLEQVEALNKTNQSIEQLHRMVVKEDRTRARRRCLSYINACLSDVNNNNNHSQSMMAVDEKFQMLIIGCSLEDQKAIKKKLEQILAEIERAQPN